MVYESKYCHYEGGHADCGNLCRHPELVSGSPEMLKQVQHGDDLDCFPPARCSEAKRAGAAARNDKRQGFTLLELVTVIGIFSTLSLLILAMHAQVSDLQKRTSDEQRAVSEIRYALETIANNLRIGTVNYKMYNNQPSTGCQLQPQPGQTNASLQKVLNLIDEDKEQSSYEFLATSCPQSGTLAGCIVKKYYGTGSTVLQTAQLTAPTLKVTDFKVSILPLCNPYHDQCGLLTKRQPIITMLAAVQIPEKGGGVVTRYVQTTVSSRVYQTLPEVCPRS